MAQAYYNTSSTGASFSPLTADMVGAVPSSGGTFSGEVKFSAGTYVYSASGTAGTGGYIKIATISLASTTYQNIPIEFTVFRRGTRTSTTLSIAFSSANSADPGLTSFYFVGAGSSTDFYLHKSATSTWNLYIRKTEGYDNIGITAYETNFSYIAYKLTWGSSQVSSVPSGAVAATDNSPIVVSSSQPSGVNTRIWVKV